MTTINNALNVIGSALDANESAINIIAKNTAEAGVAGYTVETPKLASLDSVTLSNGSAGGGVVLAAVASQRDRVLNARIDQQTSESAATGARLSAMQDLQSVFQDSLSTGTATNDIGQQITQVLDNFSSLAADPTNVSLRQGVLSAAQSLTAAFNQAASAIRSQRRALDADVVDIAGQVNTLTQNIAALNQQISSLGTTGDAGQLEDERQLDLTNLSRMIGINQITNENDGLTITTSAGAVLVAGSQNQRLSTSPALGVNHVYIGTSDVTDQLAAGGGQIGGVISARDTDLPSTLGSLDTLAFDFATAVNTAHSQGVDENGSTGLPVFNLPGTAAGSASSISVALSDPAQIAASGAGAGSSDGSNASQIANLANSSIVAGSNPGDFYSAVVTQVGSLANHLSLQSSAQQASLQQLTTHQSALSAVNMDDQAVALERVEQAYQAASKVFAILNTVMASAINLGTETAVN